MKSFDQLTEQEILALAISSEEEDGRTYADFAEGLREEHPDTAHVFSEPPADPHGLRQGQHRPARRQGHLVPAGWRRDMAQAGATNVQVQEAYSKAWQLTAKYQNMGAVDILKVMNDARAIFGSQDVATHDIEPLIRIGSFLRSGGTIPAAGEKGSRLVCGKKRE